MCTFVLFVYLFGFSVAWMAFGETWVEPSDGKLDLLRVFNGDGLRGNHA